jgi:hypothetical protein
MCPPNAQHAASCAATTKLDMHDDPLQRLTKYQGTPRHTIPPHPVADVPNFDRESFRHQHTEACCPSTITTKHDKQPTPHANSSLPGPKLLFSQLHPPQQHLSTTMRTTQLRPAWGSLHARARLSSSPSPSSTSFPSYICRQCRAIQISSSPTTETRPTGDAFGAGPEQSRDPAGAYL